MSCDKGGWKHLLGRRASPACMRNMYEKVTLQDISDHSKLMAVAPWGYLFKGTYPSLLGGR